jgi:FkbM family methyltransferase
MKKNEDYEYFLFEPLPLFKGIGKRLATKFPNVSITYSTKAIWTENGKMNFYLSTRSNKGSSLCKNKVSGRMDHDNPITVETLDFSKWIEQNFSKDDYIVIKMDIEGAEYEVIPKMIEDKTIDYVNEMMVEFHSKRQLKGDYIHARYKELHEYFEQSETKLISWS